jgi:hypothetical protein
MYSNLMIGDLLYRDKGVVGHAGVYLGSNQVLHIQPGGRPVRVPFEQYSDGRLVSVKRQKIDRQGFTQRLADIGQGSEVYRLISNNCEHTAYYLSTGNRMSPQIQVALGFGFVGGMVASRGETGRFVIAAGLFGLAALLVSNANRQHDFVVDAKLPQKTGPALVLQRIGNL